MVSTMSRDFLFLLASTRRPGVVGNTETLARRAARSLGPDVGQTWLSLSEHRLAPFIDQRHDAGTYPPPSGDEAKLLQATMAATDIVFVSPVYWSGAPSPLKLYLDHWSGWMRTPDVPFSEAMAQKRLWVVTTNGDRAKAEPMLTSYRMCAEFLSMRWGGALWGPGGPPGRVDKEAHALAAADAFFVDR
ncbi:MAG: NAD(P)H-dependent oxidoreductase [Myxococcales bacterium FL481]|nr:MAG: NAD(P)H-dependent oxidoreductase [Myxococcales bacterium FL481]